MDYKGDKVMVEKQLKETLKNTDYPDSQFFISYSERDKREGDMRYWNCTRPTSRKNRLLKTWVCLWKRAYSPRTVSGRRLINSLTII